MGKNERGGMRQVTTLCQLQGPGKKAGRFVSVSGWLGERADRTEASLQVLFRVAEGGQGVGSTADFPTGRSLRESVTVLVARLAGQWGPSAAAAAAVGTGSLC